MLNPDTQRLLHTLKASPNSDELLKTLGKIIRDAYECGYREGCDDGYESGYDEAQNLYCTFYEEQKDG